MNPSDPSDVESATLQHRRPTDVQDSELGAEGERPTYDDAVAEEIGGDYDYAEADTSLNDDDDVSPPHPLAVPWRNPN